jgi:hypothetical protein
MLVYLDGWKTLRLQELENNKRNSRSISLNISTYAKDSELEWFIKAQVIMVPG